MPTFQRSLHALKFLLLVLFVGLMLNACKKNSGPNALEEQARTEDPRSSIEGTWIVDVVATYAEEFSGEHPDLLLEFARTFRGGYAINKDTLRYVGASYGTVDEFAVAYEVVEQSDQRVLLRLTPDENDPETEMFLGDANHFEFRFDDREHAALVIWHKDDDGATETSDDEALGTVQLKRVSQESFDDHFESSEDEYAEPAGQELFSQEMETEIKEQGHDAPDLQKSLVGAWVLDAQHTARNLYGYSDELHPFMLRFTPIFVQFRPDGKAYWGHIDIDGKDAMETGYRVVKYTYQGEEYTLVEFAHDANDVRPAYATYMRLDQIRDDRVALSPLFLLEQLPDQDTRPLFQRVDQATFARYVEQDPWSPNVDARTQQRAAKRIAGTWVLNADMLHPEASRSDVAIGLSFQNEEAFELYAQYTENSYEGAVTIHEHGAYRILDVQDDHALVSLRFDDETLSNELVFEFLDANTMRATEPLSENRSFHAAVRDTLYLERTDEQKFRAIFTIESAP